MGSNVTAAWKIHKKGAFFANPCFTQIHPTCIPRSGEHQSKLTLMSESLRNDGRIWVPKNIHDVEAIRLGKLKPTDIKEQDRDYYLKEDIQHLEIWFHVTWRLGQQRKNRCRLWG